MADDPNIIRIGASVYRVVDGRCELVSEGDEWSDDLWDEVCAMSEDEVDAELREAGFDPESIADHILDGAAAKLGMTVPEMMKGISERLAQPAPLHDAPGPGHSRWWKMKTAGGIVGEA